MAAAAPNMKAVREELLWTAIKARKANAIDQKALDVIKKLLKEPSSPETDEKVLSFANQFNERLQGKVSPRAQSRVLANMPKPSDSFAQMDDAVIKHIASYLGKIDMTSLALTSYSLSTSLFPVGMWKQIITNLLLPPSDVLGVEDVNEHGEEEEPLRQAQAAQPRAVEHSLTPAELAQLCHRLDKEESLFKVPDPERFKTDLRYARNISLRLLGRGLTVWLETDMDRATSFLLSRLIIPRLSMLQIRVAASIQQAQFRLLASGDPLTLERVCIRHGREWLLECKFRVLPCAEVPPIVSDGGRLDFQALEHDGRTISSVEQWTLREHAGSTKFLNAVNARGQSRGSVFITIGGERSAKYLGRLLHNDEHFFAKEVRSSAEGSHGMGSLDVRNRAEIVTYQTPRIVYKPPANHYEICQRNGVILEVSLPRLFLHCFIGRST